MAWLWTLLAVVMGLWQSQPNSTLNAPVSALAVNGDRLLIGQNDQLVEAAITPNDLTITRALVVGRGAIRAIAALDNGTELILSEDGLTAVDSSGSITDFAPGGGYRLSTHGNRVYVAALAAGVRIYTLSAGKLTLAGKLNTNQPVEDVAAEGANWLWTAEGGDGVRLYDLTVPTKPAVISESSTFHPAHLVRAGSLRLIVGYGGQLALLDTLNFKAPRLIGTIALGGSAGAYASDAILDQAELLVGRVDVSGADVLHYQFTNSAGTPGLAFAYGSDGAGSTIARHGDDLFIGSEQIGLRRLKMDSSGWVAVNAWNVSNFPVCATADYTPVNPSPGNLSLLPETDRITLTWSSACLAERYTVNINGQPAGVIGQSTFDYVLPSDQDVFNWQVDALTDSGTIHGPLWIFERAPAGYIASPSAPRLDRVFYVPPRMLFDFTTLQTPIGVLVLACTGLLIGLLIVIVGAWAIGVRAARRREQV